MGICRTLAKPVTLGQASPENRSAKSSRRFCSFNGFELGILDSRHWPVKARSQLAFPGAKSSRNHASARLSNISASRLQNLRLKSPDLTGLDGKSFPVRFPVLRGVIRPYPHPSPANSKRTFSHSGWLRKQTLSAVRTITYGGSFEKIRLGKYLSVSIRCIGDTTSI